MKLKKFFSIACLGVVCYAGFLNKKMIEAIKDLEKTHADLFVRIENAQETSYLCKNTTHGENAFLEWIHEKGWNVVDQVGESFFFVNADNESLLINREVIVFDRYLMWKLNKEIQ